jgi:trehalose-6-phosphatase
MHPNKDIIPIYIGDDTTDEDAFKALKNKGLTIFVGKPKISYAEYYLRSTKEVFEFLKQILRIAKDI